MKLAGASESGNGNAVYALLVMALAAGILGGSIYLVRGWSSMGEGIGEYLNGFFSSVQSGGNSIEVFKSSLASNMITLAVIFVMGFFRFGAIGTGLIILRRGFVMGFASASFLRLYGARGMIIMLSSMPGSLIAVPAMLIFSAVSIRFSMNDNRIQKRILIPYILTAVFIAAVFGGASFAEGFLTTAIMSRISP